VRRLIVNADDFGLTAGVNRAILEAHSHGIVTSSTLMANGPAFEDAVRVAQSFPGLSVGCHIVLVDGSPVLEPSRVASLISDSNGSQQFREKLGSFSFLAISGRLDSGEIEAEITAQIRKLQSYGIAVSHLDTHKHTHILPHVLKPLLRAAKACGVHAMRNPFEPATLALLAENPGWWRQCGKVKALHSLAGMFRRAAKEAGVVTPDGTVGVVGTGYLTENRFLSMVERLPEGTWEFVCHPGYNDDDLQKVKTRLRESREEELRILTSPSVREWLHNKGIELITYRQLAANLRPATPDVQVL